ncbi:MAG TPA: serine/threonine-protein kinase [Bryobacteraceae bacterium]|nr:serine/threonine-protein kinase [Bryobacteraceae bacterium]
MSPELHQRVRKLFEEALARPESERPAFLDHACFGDPELRQTVERLLDAHRDSDDFLKAETTTERRLGRYLLSRELGRGSMGVVFEGIDPLIGRHVAVKVIRIDPATEAGQPGFVRDQFFREAHSAGKLLHPGIVVIFDVGQQGDAAFIAMELVEGPSLENMLEANPRPPLAQAMEILRQAAAAVDYAHQNGIIHRDIKPANIMLQRGTTVKIADFGVAKINTAQRLTATGLILGTPTYMSPEQLEMRPLDGRSDQFSLAVVAYEMLTGSRPFEAPSLAPLTHLIVYGDRPSARAANPALTEAADAVLRKAMAKLPEERYASCGGFVAALSEALRDAPQGADTHPVAIPMAIAAAAPAEGPAEEPAAAPVATAPVAAPQPAAPAPEPEIALPPAAPVRRNSAVIWLLAACLAVAALLGGGVWVFESSSWQSWLARVAAPSPAAPAAGRPGPPPVSPVSPASPAAPAPAAPTVVEFTASSGSVVAGNQATLRWQVKDATDVRISPQVGAVAASGAIAIQPTESTTYTLTARGPGGEESAHVSIAVTRKAQAAAPPVSGSALYENGLAERKAGHTAKAFDLFRQAAELGNVPAMLEVAEEGLDSDNGDSERWFRKAAELGNPTAMLNLGAMYQLGNHVKEDYVQAVAWYRKAAQLGDASAMYNLGRMYERGRGVPKDMGMAKELYQKAASKGNSDARIRLDQMPDK